MSNQPQPNPYAPIRLDGEPFPAAGFPHLPTIGLLAATFGGIVLSGATFGLILAGILSLAKPTDVLEVVMLLPVGIFAGAVIAGISGIPTVLAAFCLAAPLIPFSKGWLPHQARNFAVICGFLSGSSPVILIDVRDPWSWLIAVIPGAFGALGTMFFVRWILRATNRSSAGKVDRTLVEGSGNNVT